MEPQEADISTTQQSTSAQRGPALSSVPSDGTQLRSRVRHSTAASTGDSSSETSRDNSGQTGDTESGVAESERPSQRKEEEGERGGGEDDSLITVRLIMYGSTTKPVRVSPTTTLTDMRRYSS